MIYSDWVVCLTSPVGVELHLGISILLKKLMSYTLKGAIGKLESCSYTLS